MQNLKANFLEENIMSKDFLQLIFEMMQEGGALALDFMRKGGHSLKADSSVVTEADLAISRLVRDKLKDLLATEEHLLIDEEDAQNAQSFDLKRLESKPYVWAVDPIDGTRAFSNRIPVFGVSVGLLKDLKPWMGGVYFPMTRELFYCDGQNSFFVQNAFSEKEIKAQIVPIDQNITSQSIFLSTDGVLEYFEWDSSFCQIMLPTSAVTELCWPAIGRGCGSLFRANIWDFAGSWPVFRSAGLDLRAYETGAVLNCLDLERFDGQGLYPWKMKEFCVLSSERNFSVIKEHLPAKSGVNRT